MKTSSPANDTTSTLSIGETFENSAWRLHRFATSVRVTSLLNAGKRGKLVEQMSLSYVSEDEPVEKFLAILMCFAQNGATVEAMEELLRLAQSARVYSSFAKYDLRGVDVVPAGFKTVRIDGDLVNVTAEFGNFRISDLTDKANEPTCIPRPGNNKKSIKAFYAWVSANQAEIKTMSFGQVMRAMEAQGIDGHQYCAVD